MRQKEHQPQKRHEKLLLILDNTTSLRWYSLFLIKNNYHSSPQALKN